VMLPVPVGFPFQLDDEQLDEAIREMLERDNWPGFDNFALLRPELKIALLDAGLREQQRREEAASAARVLQATYAILAVSIVTLVVAVLTVLAA
jgi:hypothetical protein